MGDGLRKERILWWTIAFGALVICVVAFAGLAGCQDEEENSPVHIEEFRVAEPLATDPESALRNRLEIITAVTEPFDEVEASVDDESEQVATSSAALADQCVTVLKEMAFCTNDDAFLDIIARAPNLQADKQRERFMDRIQHWYEPGGSRVDCEQTIETEDALSTEEARYMWQQAAEASEELCTDFGETLLKAQAFRWIVLF